MNFKDVPFELWEIKRFDNDTIVLNQYQSKSEESIEKVVGNSDSIINKVNKEIVSLINYFGAKAFSLTYKNSKILEGEKTPNIKKLNHQIR